MTNRLAYEPRLPDPPKSASAEDLYEYLLRERQALFEELRYLRRESRAATTSYAPIASPTFTGTVTLPATTSVGNVSSAELGYLDGVTSAVQTQLDAKAPLASPTFTGTVTTAAQSVGGSATFTGTARRILGDLSNATASNRMAVQNSQSNAASYLGVLPSGSGSRAEVLAWNGSDADAAGFVSVGINGAAASLRTSSTGGTSPTSIDVTIGALRQTWDVNGNVVIGSAALATNATDGFFWVPSCAGTPSGTPAGSYTGRLPLVYDSTNNIMYVYNGAWKASSAFT